MRRIVPKHHRLEHWMNGRLVKQNHAELLVGHVIEPVNSYNAAEDFAVTNCT
jgi:hypothetical protein